MAPRHSMRSLGDMGNPYQYTPEVSIRRLLALMGFFGNLIDVR